MPGAQHNGLELHYSDTGKGDPLVLLNGLAGDHLYWVGQVRAFMGRFRCLAPDNRDSGRSPYADAPYAVPRTSRSTRRSGSSYRSALRGRALARDVRSLSHD